MASPEDSVGARLDVDAALADLPEEFRVAVVLRDLCDLDYAEIAEVLGVPPGTVRSRIARGRSGLCGGAREPRVDRGASYHRDETDRIMTDDLPPDERDEELGSLLEVPPLDDVTRQRLVTHALDDAAPRRGAPRLSRVLVPVAAALVALVLVGVGVFAVVNRDGNDAGTAARSRAPDAASPGGRAPRPTRPRAPRP